VRRSHNNCRLYCGLIDIKEIAITMLSNMESRREGIKTSPIPPRNAQAGDTI
jgi:hypothetical protein